jgi:hypothetical protein
VQVYTSVITTVKIASKTRRQMSNYLAFVVKLEGMVSCTVYETVTCISYPFIKLNKFLLLLLLRINFALEYLSFFFFSQPCPVS